MSIEVVLIGRNRRLPVSSERYYISNYSLLLIELVPPLVDHTRYFRHAPVRLRVDANMCGFARGCAAVCLPRPPWFA